MEPKVLSLNICVGSFTHGFHFSWLFMHFGYISHNIIILSFYYKKATRCICFFCVLYLGNVTQVIHGQQGSTFLIGAKKSVSPAPVTLKSLSPFISPSEDRIGSTTAAASRVLLKDTSAGDVEGQCLLNDPAAALCSPPEPECKHADGGNTHPPQSLR